MSSKSKRNQAQQVRDTDALEKASSLQLDAALGELSTSSVAVQGLFSTVQQALIAEYSKFKSLSEANQLKESELVVLHGKDALLLSIDDLKIKFDKDKTALQEEMITLRRTHEQEEAEYKYTLLQVRKESHDQWVETCRVQALNNKIRQEEFERAIKEREDALQAKEAEYKTALDKIASFDDVVKKEVEKQVSILTNVLKKDAGHVAQLVEITHKSEVDRLQSDNRRLLEIISNNDAVITSLQLQVKVSHEAQTRLASEAVSAAANQKGMADMQSLLTNIGGPNGARAKS